MTMSMMSVLDVSSHLLAVDDESCELIDYCVVFLNRALDDVLDGDHTHEFARVLLANEEVADIGFDHFSHAFINWVVEGDGDQVGLAHRGDL